MAANMYRVGDYVYFETSSTTPYQIRRVEDLCKTPAGNVEAKVMCFYRRRDISSSLILLADKHQSENADEDSEDGIGNEGVGSIMGKDEMSEKQRHQLKHRELFLSRQVETLPATHIRGKCNITLLNETEALMSYLSKEDTFFYSLVYDPQQKTLLADKGEIRVGPQFQAELTALLKSDESDGRDLSNLEQLQWVPNKSITDNQLNQFLIISRSVGAFARALDCTSTVRQPSLHMSAAAASRDITLFHALDMLHKCDYNMSEAVSSLIPISGPVLCRDEMEEWSASEANLFEEALDKYGKDFNDIRQDFLPWKSLKSIIEYYYMWKTTDRYVQQKRIKAAEADSKLKQVYIPNYNKASSAQIIDKVNGVDIAPDRACESCYTTHSSQWYTWGPTHMQCRLCSSCWNYWKKYGGLMMPTRLDGPTVGGTERTGTPSVSTRAAKCTIANCSKEFRTKSHLAQHLATAHNLVVRASSPSPIVKTRAAFSLVTTPLTRISRQLCKTVLDIHRAARRPFNPINILLIKQECQLRLPELMNKLHLLKAKKRVPMEKVSARLGIDIKMDKPSLLRHLGGERKQGSSSTTTTTTQQLVSRCTFPVQPNSTQQRIRVTVIVPDSSVSQPSSLKRSHEHVNGSESGPPSKVSTTMVVSSSDASVKQMKPKMRASTMNRMNKNGGSSNGTKLTVHKQNFIDSSDHIFFVSSSAVRKRRREMSMHELKHGARKPWDPMLLKLAVMAKESIRIVVSPA